MVLQQKSGDHQNHYTEKKGRRGIVQFTNMQFVYKTQLINVSLPNKCQSCGMILILRRVKSMSSVMLIKKVVVMFCLKTSSPGNTLQEGKPQQGCHLFTPVGRITSVSYANAREYLLCVLIFLEMCSQHVFS